MVQWYFLANSVFFITYIQIIYQLLIKKTATLVKSSNANFPHRENKQHILLEAKEIRKIGTDIRTVIPIKFFY